MDIIVPIIVRRGERNPQDLPPCDCKRMTMVLRRLGAAHAARMHEAMTLDPNHPWSMQDWLIHFSEEERFIFPVMVQAGMRAAVERLARDHGVFREQFRRFGTVDRRLLDEHAKFEDQLILQLESRVG